MELTANQPSAADRPWEVGPLALGDPEAIELLGAALRDAGYVEPSIAQILGVDVSWSLSQHALGVYLRRLAPPSPLHTLIQLFALNVPVEEAAAEEALAPADPGRLEALGLLERRAGRVGSLVGIAEHRGRFIVHDPHPGGGQDLRPDHVLGLNPSTLTLAQLTVRPPVEATLDVGTGGGFQAFLAAGHSRRVLGTDTNLRALNLAAWGARLNGIDNLELVQGSWFEPAEGKTFDLIVCNPPT